MTREPEWKAPVPLVAGIVALVLLFGGVGGWSVGTKLAGAVIATGTIQVERNRQVVQHPDGGVVKALLVRDGDQVAAGDVLIRLDDNRVASELAIVEGQLREMATRRARLAAERVGADTMTFPETLLNAATADPEIRVQMDGETALFDARREALNQQIDLLRQQNMQITNRVDGIRAQVRALTRQRDLVSDDLVDQRKLLTQRLVPASVVSGLEREDAALEGQEGRLLAEIAELQSQVTANEIARLQLLTARREEAVTTERDLQFSEIELSERFISLKDRLSRMELRAPVAGIVHDSQIFAEQAVIQPAEAILYIVPQDQPLIVEARVMGNDIDDVHIGQEVAMRFSAFSQQGKDPVTGKVINMSADALTDEATGQSYYAVDIRPDPEGLALLEPDETLLPGMPVETYLRTRDRTAFAYLTEPFTAFFDRTFRE